MTRPVVHTLRKAFGRFLQDRRGGGAIELCIALPLMMGVFMAATECGLYMTRQIMLERAVDITVRELRLGKIPDPNHAKLKASICENGSIIRDCSEALRVDMVPVSTTTWNFPTGGIQCVDRDEPIDLQLDFNPGADNEMMLIRVCVIQDAIFPGLDFTKGLAFKGDSAGGYALTATSAFVNEPT